MGVLIPQPCSQRICIFQVNGNASRANSNNLHNLRVTREVSVQMEIVGRKLAEILGVEHIEREAYTQAAQREFSAMPIGKAMQTGNFLATMRRALRKEWDAINAGDKKVALDAHRKAMLNMEFVRESRAIARSQKTVEGQENALSA